MRSYSGTDEIYSLVLGDTGMTDHQPITARRAAGLCMALNEANLLAIEVGGHAVQVRAAVGLPTGHDRMTLSWTTSPRPG